MAWIDGNSGANLRLRHGHRERRRARHKVFDPRKRENTGHEQIRHGFVNHVSMISLQRGSPERIFDESNTFGRRNEEDVFRDSERVLEVSLYGT